MRLYVVMHGRPIHVDAAITVPVSACIYIVVVSTCTMLCNIVITELPIVVETESLLPRVR